MKGRTLSTPEREGQRLCMKGRIQCTPEREGQRLCTKGRPQSSPEHEGQRLCMKGRPQSSPEHERQDAKFSRADDGPYVTLAAAPGALIWHLRSSRAVRPILGC